MFALLLLAGASRCASAAFCPSDTQLLDAFRDWRDAQAISDAEQARKADPGRIVLIEPIRVLGIRDVRCGYGSASGNRVACRFTIKFYGGRVTAYSAVLKRDAGRWLRAEDTAFSTDPQE